MNNSQPLTPSYSCALAKYQRAVEPRLIEATAIKARDAARALHELEKTRHKSGSAKHVQKNGVIYKKLAVGQIAERTEEELDYRASVKNAAVQRKVNLANKEWRKLITNLGKKVTEWKKNAKEVDRVYIDCVEI